MPYSPLIHWRALCILYGSLLVSIAFAVVHHVYYQSLAGTPVSTANDLAIGTWAGVPSQKFNIALGNTFASLFRTSISIAVSTAYLQIVWRALKNESTKLIVVDAISGILANPLGFLNEGAWKKSAILLPLAVTIWLLPIASIITPATLTVETISHVSHDWMNVTSVDFNSMNFASIVSNSQGRCGFYYSGPQFEVQKIATAAAGQNAVLSISAPGSYPNVSYVQQSAGPALQCSEVEGTLRSQIISNVNNSSWNVTTSYGYLAWVPTETDSLPFQLESLGNGYKTWQLRQDAIGPKSDAPLTIFVAAFPNFRNPYKAGGMDPNWSYTAGATVVHCKLMNATYSTSYKWTNGIRDLNVTVTPSGRSISYPNAIGCTDFLFMNGFPGTDTAHVSPQPLSDYNNTLVQNFAYASVMHAFTNLLKGSIYYPRFPNGLVTSTRVMSTTLGATKELFALRNQTASDIEALAALGPQFWPGVSVQMQTNDTSNLRATLELMFQNVTMSLMSSPLLQPDTETPYYPSPVNVTTITYQNLYVYSASMLWLAYGIAFLIATITVVVGCVAIFSGNVSYSSSFSTVLRTTSHAYVSQKISREYAMGQDPVPKYLAEATITFDYANRDEEETATEEYLVALRRHELRPVHNQKKQHATW